jgi:hypothetical protein
MGIWCDRPAGDRESMLWPVAALAALLSTFAIVYGSILQSRFAAALKRANPDPVLEAEPERPMRPSPKPSAEPLPR